MQPARVTELEYSDSVASRFRALADLPWPVWLDSAARGGPSGRYDIVAADPCVTLRTRGRTTEIATRGGATTSSPSSPFALLRAQLGERCAVSDGLPFCGGAIGYFGYDLGRLLERMPSIAAADVDMPELAVGIYDWAVVVDHEKRSARLVGLGRDARTFEQWPHLLERLALPAAAATRRAVSRSTRAHSTVSRDEYAAAFRARAGAHPLGRLLPGESHAALRGARRRRSVGRVSEAPRDQSRAVRGVSRFPGRQGALLVARAVLACAGDRVETKPIKGTRPRAADGARDRALADALRASAKDRAENVMIVDLLRNDFGKACVPGSVRATKLFDIESFASVHQLVSTVEGRLAPGKDALDLLEGCFPGGSITGAPKVRAMQIIEDLEPQRRGVYCGAIGYVGYDGNMSLNIAIRTLVQHGDSIYAWAGGGVVADSDVDAEYQESLDKAAALLAVLKEGASNVTQ